MSKELNSAGFCEIIPPQNNQISRGTSPLDNGNGIGVAQPPFPEEVTATTAAGGFVKKEEEVDGSGFVVQDELAESEPQLEVSCNCFFPALGFILWFQERRQIRKQRKKQIKQLKQQKIKQIQQRLALKRRLLQQRKEQQEQLPADNLAYYSNQSYEDDEEVVVVFFEQEDKSDEEKEDPVGEKQSQVHDDEEEGSKFIFDPDKASVVDCDSDDFSFASSLSSLSGGSRGSSSDSDDEGSEAEVGSEAGSDIEVKSERAPSVSLHSSVYYSAAEEEIEDLESLFAESKKELQTLLGEAQAQDELEEQFVFPDKVQQVDELEEAAALLFAGVYNNTNSESQAESSIFDQSSIDDDSHWTTTNTSFSASIDSQRLLSDESGDDFSILTSSSTATLIREIQKEIDNFGPLEEDNSSIESIDSKSLSLSLIDESLSEQKKEVIRIIGKSLFSSNMEDLQETQKEHKTQVDDGSAGVEIVAKTDAIATAATATEASAAGSTTISNATPELMTAVSSMSDGSTSTGGMSGNGDGNQNNDSNNNNNNNNNASNKMISNTNIEASMETSNHVYILHPNHSWIPAKVLEKKSDTEFVLNIPEYLNEQAISNDGGRHAKRFEKQVHDISKYPNNALPLANVDSEGRLKEVEDMVDLPFLHEVRLWRCCFVLAIVG